jgi:hypothetical protein
MTTQARPLIEEQLSPNGHVTEPTKSASAGTTAARRRRPRRARQREQAWRSSMVVTALAICMVIVNDFGTRTQIDMLGSRATTSIRCAPTSWRGRG